MPSSTRRPSPARKPASPASKKAAPPGLVIASKRGAAVKAPKPETTLAAQSAAKPKQARLKLVRDSFTMPKPDFELIDALKQRALKQGREVKKSELLRAGLHSLAALADAALLAAVQAVPRLKTGRPHNKAR